MPQDASQNKKTGTIILGFLAGMFMFIGSIFTVDTYLSTESHATISEWTHNWMQNPTHNIVLVSSMAAFTIGIWVLYFHFLLFKPLK